MQLISITIKMVLTNILEDIHIVLDVFTYLYFNIIELEILFNSYNNNIN